MSKAFRFSLAAFVLFGLIAVPAFAQEATIRGKVADEEGAVLPGCLITIRNTATGVERSVTTTGAGTYSVEDLFPGPYRVTAALEGFATVVREGLTLEVGRTVVVNFEMKLAAVAETVTVTGEAPLIETTESDIGAVVSEKQIDNIPLNTRNFQELAFLAPGARVANNFDPTKSRVTAVSIGGSGTGRGINVSIDGGDNNDDAVGGILQQFSQESIQEFEVITSRYKAEYGRSAGGVINVLTKTGTNEIHGTAFEFFRDDGLNARNQPEKDAGLDKSDYRRHQFGFSVGGPIVQDRTHYFGTFERLDEQQSTVLRGSDLLEALYPEDWGLVPQPYERNYVTLKLSHQLNADQSIAFRYGYEDNTQEGDQIGRFGLANVSASSQAVQSNEFHNFLAKHTWVISDRALNDFRYQYNWFDNLILAPGQSELFQILEPTFVYDSGFTRGTNPNVPQQTHQVKHQFKDDFSYHLDRHDLKAGIDVVRVPEFFAGVPFQTNGIFYYANDTDALDEAYFLFITGPPTSAVSERDNTQIGLYFQDDWQVTDRFTLNLGIRYDVEPGSLDVPFNDFISFLLVDHPNAPFPGAVIETDKNNIGPRIGAAYDLTGDGTTVIRGGWGLYYDQTILNSTLFNDLDANDPPFALLSISTPPFGPDAIPSLDSLIDTFGFSFFRRSISPTWEMPQIQQASIGFSHQFDPTTVLDADFVYSKGENLSKMTNVNETLVRGSNASRPLFPDLGARLNVVDSVGEDEYKGLQLSFKKRMDQMQFLANYTLARLEGSAQGLYDASECTNAALGTLGGSCINDERDIGPLPNDATHLVVLSGIFELPAGFQFSALGSFESARPASRGADSVFDVNGNGDSGTSAHRVDWAPGPNGEEAGRGNFRGDPTYTVDIRVTKFFNLSERVSIEGIFEVFNLFNTVNQGGNFNIATNYRPPEFGSFTENPDFGLWDGTLFNNQRQIQLGARLNF